MAFVTITCPQCGGQAQIEAGRSVMCPYCGREIAAPPADSGFAFAQDVQCAPQQQSAVQFAPPPAQSAAQFAPQQTQDPSVFAQPAQQSYAAPAPQYHPQVLAEAQQKRKNWYTINGAFMVFQTLLFAAGVLFAAAFYENIGTALILMWLLSLGFFALLSAALRPDAAYIDKRPAVKSKVAWCIMQFLLSASATSAVGAIVFAILNALFG